MQWNWRTAMLLGGACGMIGALVWRRLDADDRPIRWSGTWGIAETMSKPQRILIFTGLLLFTLGGVNAFDG